MPRAAAVGNVLLACGETAVCSYFLMVIAAGVAYAIIGILFGALAGAAPNVAGREAWRLAAWIVSAAIFSAHIVYERRRTASSPSGVALRVAIGAGLGALGLALGAVYHSMNMNPRGHFPLWALAVWPIITAIPAFIVAVTITSLLTRMRASASA